jgi:hypothetical protein
MNPQARSRLNALYPAISGINAPLWYTIEQNIFQEYGLEGVHEGNIFTFARFANLSSCIGLGPIADSSR